MTDSRSRCRITLHDGGMCRRAGGRRIWLLAQDIDIIGMKPRREELRARLPEHVS